jgi:hypothetical protein
MNGPFKGAVFGLVCAALAACQASESSREAPDAAAEARTAPATNVSSRSDPVSVSPNDPALCRLTAVPEGSGRAGLKLEGQAGNVSLYAEPGGLICSEPSATGGDCQIVQGRKVTVAQAGRDDIRVEALSPSPYLIYGESVSGGVRCTRGPATVPRPRSRPTAMSPADAGEPRTSSSGVSGS